jgi:hypothetical protein
MEKLLRGIRKHFVILEEDGDRYTFNMMDCILLY